MGKYSFGGAPQARKEFRSCEGYAWNFGKRGESVPSGHGSPIVKRGMVLGGLQGGVQEKGWDKSPRENEQSFSASL